MRSRVPPRTGSISTCMFRRADATRSARPRLSGEHPRSPAGVWNDQATAASSQQGRGERSARGLPGGAHAARARRARPSFGLDDVAPMGPVMAHLLPVSCGYRHRFRDRQRIRIEREHSCPSRDKARHGTQIAGLSRIARDVIGFLLKAQVADARRQTIARDAGVVSGAGCIERVDRAKRRVVARAAVITMEEQRWCAGIRLRLCHRRNAQRGGKQ